MAAAFFTGATQPQAFCPKSLAERKLEIPTTTNNTLELHTSFEATPAARLQSSRVPYLYTSTSTRLRRISRPRYLYASSTSLHLQHASRARELLRQTPPRLHACSAPPELQSSIPLYVLHVPTPPARSRSPYLDVPTPATHLQTSIPPHLHMST